LWGLIVLALGGGLVACPDEVDVPRRPVEPAARGWHLVGAELGSALLSVSARATDDVFFAGADKGKGPAVWHYDGKTLEALPTPFSGDLWWIHAFPQGPVLVAGQGALVGRWEGGRWERLATPGFARQTLYGLWGRAPNDLYVVGGAAGRDGFIWHFDGTSFRVDALPPDIPRTARGEIPGLFKVWGDADTVWVVGGAGTILRKRGQGAFENVPSGTRETLFTVHGAGDRVMFVGGGTQGVLLESVGGALPAQVALPGVPLLQGVFASPQGQVAAVGERGQVLLRFDAGATPALQSTGFESQLTGLSLHAASMAPTGELWAVGGNVLTPALDRGTVLFFGPKDARLPRFPTPATHDGGVEAGPEVVCPPEDLAYGRGKSVARRWDEQNLAAIRRDLPRPPVHARNLFHLSAAMWDAWAAYDPLSKGVFVRDKITEADPTRLAAARDEAVAYAAFRVVSHRYAKAVGAATSQACFRAVMRELGYDPEDTRERGDDARAVGNRIGRFIVEQSRQDGANEADDYRDPRPDPNPNLKIPLVVDEPGVPAATNPSYWQPVNLAVAATQNGIILPAGTQGYIGSLAGETKPFALTRDRPESPWLEAGTVPRLENDADLMAMRPWVVEAIQRQAELDADDGVTMDVSPKSLGNNGLGSNDGRGYAQNPVTGAPYEPVIVPRGDFGRVLAEYWADGPKSETPPGHWNIVANWVSDAAGSPRKLGGVGPSLDPLAWDVHVYLALNGAVHDAAIAAWDIKRRGLGPRPITLIRYMGQRGQSSDPGAASYHREGLPLVAGLIELITAESSRAGQRHAHLAPFVGQVAVRAWRGEPGDRVRQAAGVGWIRAVDWIPYQRRNFVTPAFPGFVSGHSTFSRAAAEVLAGITGSPYFPGGYHKVDVRSTTFLSFERGPSRAFSLGWASYYDAADQAGQSRIWGGIHIEPDDFVGRRLGSVAGKGALRAAYMYFDGSAP
jgi:hypothetical protein